MALESQNFTFFFSISVLSTYVPPDVRDIWEDRDVAEAPYTQASAEHKKAPFLGSTANLSQNEQTPFIPMARVKIEIN